MQPRFHPLALLQSAYRPRPAAWFWTRAVALLIVAGPVAVLCAVLWAAPVRAQAQPVHDFDQWCKWRRGAQPWGNLARSDEQVHQGAFAGELAYDFPEGEAANFVVFQCAKPLTGTPEYLSVWVYGDGAGNLLNAWVQDATGLRWQFGFGPVDFTGWQRMTADLAPGQAWPNGPLDGANADTVVYPIRFDGFALDNPSSDAAQGVIYLDDLRASSLADTTNPAPNPARLRQASGQRNQRQRRSQRRSQTLRAVSGSGAPSSEGAAVSGDGAEPAQDPEVDFRVDPSSIEAGQCATLRWTVRHVRQYFVDGEGKGGDTGRAGGLPGGHDHLHFAHQDTGRRAGGLYSRS